MLSKYSIEYYDKIILGNFYQELNGKKDLNEQEVKNIEQNKENKENNDLNNINQNGERNK